MHDVLFVRGLQRAHDVIHDGERPLDGERGTAPEEFLQRAALDVLHLEDPPRLVCQRVYPVERDDVGAVEAGDQARLA